VPTPADVERIVAIRSPVLRNLEITHAYGQLARAMAQRTCEGANWCSFATWASRQAGRTIRGEDLIGHVQLRLGRGAGVLHPLSAIGRWLLRWGLFHPDTLVGRITDRLHTPFDAFERASAAVARGNLKVFAEIGFEFSRYLHECPADAEPDSPEFVAFLEGLRPGEPPEGQRLLRQAFGRYQRQRFESDPKVRCEMALLANLEIGLHEQIRLQPEIREALDAPYVTREDLRRRMLSLVPGAARRPRMLSPVVWTLTRLGVPLEAAMGRFARDAITASFMVLALPNRVLALGQHLDAGFPESLQELTDGELAALVARCECLGGEVDDCGARDWGVLEQRMHYIVHLFRAFHSANELFRPPFSEHQVCDFCTGVVPFGDL
jgi:hypothetical protein